MLVTFPPLAFTTDIKHTRPSSELWNGARDRGTAESQHCLRPTGQPRAHPKPPASVYPSQGRQEGSPGTPVPAGVPPAPAAAATQSPRAICHTNPSLTAYPSSPFVLPARHKSAGKQLGVKENKNSCRHKDVWHSLGTGLRAGCVEDSLPCNFWVRFGQ